MPQARSGGSSSTSRSRSTSGAKSSSGKSQAKRSTSGASSSRAKSTRAGSSRSTGAKSASAAAEARYEAAAQRVRKLNERIIEAGKEAGETTLDSYEKALKAIAGAIEKGPGKSDIEWISSVATAQAKFIRDVTEAWTKAARERLK
jgi:hypothetical protein